MTHNATLELTAKPCSSQRRTTAGRPRWPIGMASLVPCIWVMLGAPALADEPSGPDEQLEKVVIEGAHVPQVAEAVLGATSPQTVIGPDALRNLVPLTGDFGTIANLSPSFTSSAPNGPGFDAAKGTTLRGFTDGQFNVTLDGIPFADPDNFQHHSTSYFPVSMLDHVVIDRSPGGAGDLGYATFGGSLNMFSENLPDTALRRVFGSYGSFNTSLIGTTVSTARPTESGEVGVLGTVQFTRSDGAMTFSPGNKTDAQVKAEGLWGPAKVTFLYNYDHYDFYNPGNITSTELADFGPSFGYVSDLASPNDFHYSSTTRATDFGYIRIEPRSTSGPLLFTETLYTYSYRNTGLSLKGDQTSSPIGAGFAGINPDDIAGKVSFESYRVVGNDLRLTYSSLYGTLLAGVWAEHSSQSESRDAQDLTTGLLYDAGKATQSPVYYDFDADLDTVQPYLQYSFNAWQRLEVRLGVRWRDVDRELDASVLQNFLPGTDGTVSHRVTATLPSFDATYRLTSNASVYVQVARGSLVPSQSFLYTTNPARGDEVNPENTLTTQIGTVLSGATYGIGVDAYNIDFDNYVSTITQDNETFYVDSGHARYRGIETEGHLGLVPGLSLVANASLLRATFLDNFITSPLQHAGDSLPYTPRYTALVGLMYSHGPWEASLVTKFVGTEYQGANGSADGDTYRVGSYSYTNASLSYSFQHPPLAKNVRLTLAIDNLTNSDSITDNAGPSILGPQLLNVLPGRSFTGSVLVDL